MMIAEVCDELVDISAFAATAITPRMCFQVFPQICMIGCFANQAKIMNFFPVCLEFVLGQDHVALWTADEHSDSVFSVTSITKMVGDVPPFESAAHADVPRVHPLLEYRLIFFIIGRE
jgi:hypothetical protein